VKVCCIKGLANHDGPESCVAVREDRCEALTGVRLGQPLSRESFQFQALTRLGTWKATRRWALLRAHQRPGVVEDTGMGVHTLHGNREVLALAGGDCASVRIGKARSRSR
jgi:hypothetical protein